MQMGEDLHAVATRCASGSDIRAVILTGEGKMFCAGGDVIGFHAEGDGMEEHMRALTTSSVQFDLSSAFAACRAKRSSSAAMRRWIF